MIQHTTARHAGNSSGLARQTISTSPEQWGLWSGRKHYSLEVIQHPLRARMCGFGDKDRRPLAPAAVARMVVRREDNSLVDIEDVDCSFFLVTVDLWSADGTQEMNLVLHPSSADRYVPSNPSKPRKKDKQDKQAPPLSRSTGNQTPSSRTTPTPSNPRSGDNPPAGNIATPMLPPQTPAFANQGYPFPPPSPAGDPMSFAPVAPYGTTTPETPTWGYNNPVVDRNTTYPPPVLPSIHSFTHTPTAGAEGWQGEADSEIVPFRPWAAEPAAYPGAVDPSLSSAGDGRENNAWSQSDASQQSRYSHDGLPTGSSTQLDGSVYPSSSFPAQTPSQGYTHAPPPSAHPLTMPPIPRHTYTRTLVGPLSANATRLLDEHRKPGIFFLFQDLSVRTEGTFRLRLRLMNVGAPPAPEAGALRVHQDFSPVLAQSFTESFTVYSAKRFPGVPDTTALSIAFGNQGQKLPLRNRHGSSSGKRRRRGDSGSEDDSE